MSLNPVDWIVGDSEEKAKKDGDRLNTPTSADAPDLWATSDPGTTWQKERYILDRDADPYQNGGGYDQRSYMYGRDPGAADAAAQKAWQTGDAGIQVGQLGIDRGNEAYNMGGAMLNSQAQVANAYDQRAFQQGDYSAQNATLGQLGGLEANEGYSAAQAQLQQGTNQAMAGQLAMARSGRGMGGNAAAMGQAQGNLAGIQANQANQSAALRAQENAAWRGRQAANLGNVAGMQGQQSQANLNAALSSQQQNDSAALTSRGMGQDAYFKGTDASMQGYGTALQGVGASLAGQGVANDIRGQEMQGGLAQEDNQIRYWAAKNGYTLAGQQRQDQKEAGYMAAFGSVLGELSDVRAKKNIAPSDTAGSDFARGVGDAMRSYASGTVQNTPTKPPQLESSRKPDAFGRGLAYGSVDDKYGGGLYRPEGFAPTGSTERPEGFRGASARPESGDLQAFADSHPEGFDNWADGEGWSGRPDSPERNGVYKPQTVTSGGQQVELKQPDFQALDAVSQAPGSFYDYKDPSAPGADDKTHYGPMAQDLAKTPAGATAVVQQPDGKLGVDTGRLSLVNTSALSAQQSQIDQQQAQLDALLAKQQELGSDYAPDFKVDYGYRDGAYRYGRDGSQAELGTPGIQELPNHDPRKPTRFVPAGGR